jgi:hypothetical protein
VAANFSDAVSGSIAESRRQWQDFQAALTDRYGSDRGERMICALTRDDPVQDCAGPHRGRVAVVVVVVGAVLVVAGFLAFRFRRRPRR